MTKKIFDFLYHDTRRVGSILAQLDEAGLLTSITANEASETTTAVSLEGKAGGKLPFVASAEGGGKVSREASKAGQMEKTFDPLWQNARKFVDFAVGAACPVQNANMGQIVTITGKITVVDFEFLKNFMANKSIMENLLNRDDGDADGNRQQRRTNKKVRQDKKKDPPIAEIFGLFPYKIQLTIDGEVEGWATVAPEFLVTEASDLVLKYGGSLDGEWTVIGILDATPSAFSGDLIGDVSFDEGIEAFGMKLTKAMAPMARVLLGRPFDAYGLTPLVAYREIK